MNWNFFKKSNKNSKNKDGISYKGIVLNSSKTKYLANIWAPTRARNQKKRGYTIYIGSFDTIEEAIKGREEYINNLY